MAKNQIRNKIGQASTNNVTRKILFISMVFAIVYALIAALPEITIIPTDWILEQFRGVTFVSGWTPGVMVYSVLIVLFPIFYGMTIVSLLIGNRKKSKKHHN